MRTVLEDMFALTDDGGISILGGLWFVILGPAVVTAGLGYLAARTRDRSRPISVTEGIDARIRVDDEIAIDSDLADPTIGSIPLEPLKSDKISVGELDGLLAIATTGLSSIERFRRVIPEHVAACKAADTDEAAILAAKGWISEDGLYTLALTLLVRQDVSVPSSYSSEKRTLVDHHHEARDDAVVDHFRFGPEYVRLKMPEGPTRWSMEASKFICDIIAQADLESLVALSEKIQTHLDRQCELARSFCKHARPKMLNAYRLLAPFVIANRGRAPLVIGTRGTIEIKSRSGAFFSVDCEVQARINRKNDVVQTRSLSGLGIVPHGETLRLVLVSSEKLGDFKWSEEFIGASLGELDVRSTITRMNWRKCWVPLSSEWTCCRLPDEQFKTLAAQSF